MLLKWINWIEQHHRLILEMTSLQSKFFLKNVNNISTYNKCILFLLIESVFLKEKSHHPFFPMHQALCLSDAELKSQPQFDKWNLKKNEKEEEETYCLMISIKFNNEKRGKFTFHTYLSIFFQEKLLMSNQYYY